MQPEPAPAGSVPRDHRIDVLRGVSILVVLILHFHLAYDLSRSPIATILSARFVEAVARNGNYGVILFFVISGYLITGTSLRRFGALAKVSPRDFYSFRFARIVPCLVLLLAIVTPLAAAGVPYFASNKPVSILLADFSILTFWHNVLMARVGYFNYILNILWSLSVEEVFYFTFPLLCILLKRPRWILPVWCAAIVAGPLYRFRHSDNEILYLYGYWSCFDAIAMGCCVALLVRSITIGDSARRLLQVAASTWMTWVYLHSDIGSSAIWGPTMMAAGAAIFLFAEGSTRTAAQVAPWHLSRPIAWFGRHSYELYLFHVVVLAVMRNIIPSHAMRPGAKSVWFLLFVALSVGLAALIARFYSEPLNRRIRARLVSRKPQPTYVVSPPLPSEAN